MPWNQDIDNFLKCSEPHADAEAGQKAMDDFMDDLAELRRKHRMANVWMVGTFNVKGETLPTELVFTGGWGQNSQRLDLLGYAFGCAYGDRTKLLARIIEAGEKDSARDDDH